MRTIVRTARRLKRKIAVPTDFFQRPTFAMAYALALAKGGKSMVVAEPSIPLNTALDWMTCAP